ncbi:MAG: hypothetical protein ACTSVB_04510 [Candidatus Heimdallarchaeaceae archaeon]
MKKLTKQEIKDRFVIGLVIGLAVGIVGLAAGIIAGIEVGIEARIVRFVFLIFGLAAGLIFVLSITFTTQLIALITSNPEFMMFDFIVSEILLIVLIVTPIIWIYFIKKNQKEKGRSK